jgi:hypothetical protein
LDRAIALQILEDTIMTTCTQDELLERIQVLECSRNRWRRAAWVFAGAFLLAAVTGVYVGEFYYAAAVEASARAADAEQAALVAKVGEALRQQWPPAWKDQAP